MLTAVTALRPVDPTADLDALVRRRAARARRPSWTSRDSTAPTSRGCSPRPRPTSSTAPASPSTRRDGPSGSSSVEVDETGTARSTADAYVAPAATTRVWDLLLDHARTYATARCAPSTAGEAEEWSLAGGCYVEDARYAAALPAPGLAPVRRFHTMGITFDPSRPAPDARALPAGVNARGRREPTRPVCAPRTRSPTSRSSSTGEHVAPTATRTDMAWCRSRLLRPDPVVDRVASTACRRGVCLGNDHLAEHGWGYVSTLGVLEEHRGRGLGRLPAARPFFAQASRREVASG